MAEKSPLYAVLVVDDEALIRWSLLEALTEQGYVVREAGDGRSAIAAIEHAGRPFDVVLLDYRLPDSADLNLLERIRRLSPNAKVIMVTAHSSPELESGALALGAFRVINKPFEMNTLTELVAHAASSVLPSH